jgi:hypothetical protein
MYHEAFWLAVSVAAPVIALAAIVAYASARAKADRMWQWAVDRGLGLPQGTESSTDREDAQQARSLPSSLRVTASMSMTNTILQAIVLAFSLSSLASGVDRMPTGFAVVFEVAGIFILAASAWQDATFRSRLSEVKVTIPDVSKGRTGL